MPSSGKSVAKLAGAPNPGARPPLRPIQNKILGWLDNKLVEKVEAYLVNGRCFRHAETGALKEQWIMFFCRWAHDLADITARESHECIQAELSLRGEEPPYDRVQADIDLFLEKVKQRVQSLSADKLARMNGALNQNMNEFYQSAANTH